MATSQLVVTSETHCAFKEIIKAVLMAAEMPSTSAALPYRYDS